ncbi:MAG: hypothetical protein RDU20_14800 [Desulfomonilaceae bacterium]|nr:hypothetical protein [Desulfomonilaceae bacterium]
MGCIGIVSVLDQFGQSYGPLCNELFAELKEKRGIDTEEEFP